MQQGHFISTLVHYIIIECKVYFILKVVSNAGLDCRLDYWTDL